MPTLATRVPSAAIDRIFVGPDGGALILAGEFLRNLGCELRAELGS